MHVIFYRRCRSHYVSELLGESTATMTTTPEILTCGYARSRSSYLYWYTCKMSAGLAIDTSAVRTAVALSNLLTQALVIWEDVRLVWFCAICAGQTLMFLKQTLV